MTALVFRERTLHAVTLSRSRAKPQIVSLHSFNRPDGEDLALALRDNLDREASGYPVNALLDFDDYQLLLVEAPDVRPEELRSAVRWRLKDLINFHIDDAIIDVFEIPDQRHQNRNRMMYAVAARASRISDAAEILENAHLTLETVDIPEMALRNLAMLADDEVNGIALLHMDEDRSMITLSRNGTLYLTRRWGFGSRAIREASDADAVAQLEEQVQLEIQRSLDYYDSHFPIGPLAALVVTPTTAAIPGLTGFLSESTDLPVKTLDIGQRIDGAGQLADGGEVLALGAALRHEVLAL